MSLEEFIDESIRISRQHNYYPTAFIAMRQRYGTIEAISRLVIGGDIQSGFRKMQQMGQLHWTIEAAVEKFPDAFSSGIREAAKWRLKQARDASAPV